MKPYIVFVICAVIAGFGAWLLLNSHGGTERDVAPYLLVIFGLGAVVVPILLAVTDKRRESGD